MFLALNYSEQSHYASTTLPSGEETNVNNSHAQLSTFSKDDQATLLAKIVGEGCVGTSVFYRGMDADRNAYWTVTCSNGKSYQVQIQPDAGGSTRVLGCDIAKLPKVDCFQKF